jgi:hypothetical protein
MSNKMIYVVLLIAGVALLVWGLNASDSVSSEVSEALQGAPSDKSIWLLVGGGILGAIGLIGLVTKRG